MKAGDKVIEVNGVPVSDETIQEVISVDFPRLLCVFLHFSLFKVIIHTEINFAEFFEVVTPFFSDNFESHFGHAYFFTTVIIFIQYCYVLVSDSIYFSSN